MMTTASSRGRVDRLRTLLDGDPERVKERSPDGFTPLHLALFGGSGRGGSMTGSSAIGAIESRPTRNGRRSASVKSSTRMMCGVSVRMMSV